LSAEALQVTLQGFIFLQRVLRDRSYTTNEKETILAPQESTQTGDGRLPRPSDTHRPKSNAGRIRLALALPGPRPSPGISPGAKASRQSALDGQAAVDAARERLRAQMMETRQVG